MSIPMYHICSIPESIRIVYMHKWATPQEGSIEYIQMATKKKKFDRDGCAFKHESELAWEKKMEKNDQNI